MNIISKSNINDFYVSNKTIETLNKPKFSGPETKKTTKQPYIHFDFGNSMEDKKKALQIRIKNRGDTNVTKFIVPKKIDLAQQLLKKNHTIKERSLMKSQGFSEFQSSNFFQTNSFNPLPEYFTNVEFKGKNENKIDKSFFKNILSKNKKNLRKPPKRVKTESKEQNTFESSISDIKFSTMQENLRKKSENYNFYAHLKNKRKEHERIFSARSHSKKELSVERSTLNEFTQNDLVCSVRKLQKSFDFSTTILTNPKPKNSLYNKRIKSAVHY